MLSTKINFTLGSLIDQLDCDAIVNSAHPSMMAGSGVCGVIHKAAGKELETFGKQFAPLKLTQAVITPAFNIPIKHIIHVSAPRYHNEENPLEVLAESLRNVFLIAEANNLHKIALPPIGTGVYGFPIEQTIEVYANISHKFSNSAVIEEIRFVFNKNEPSSTPKIKLNMMLL